MNKITRIVIWRENRTKKTKIEFRRVNGNSKCYMPKHLSAWRLEGCVINTTPKVKIFPDALFVTYTFEPQNSH